MNFAVLIASGLSAAYLFLGGTKPTLPRERRGRRAEYEQWLTNAEILAPAGFAAAARTVEVAR